MQQTFIYQPTDLGKDFEQHSINLPDDYEGKVTATLIKKTESLTSGKAILYIHGFNDYFFQEEMATRFEEKNIKFYALDLRKYGRSYLPHQKLNNVRDLKEYDAEIIEALKIIEVEGADKVLLAGHSTGGLIVTYFAARNPDLKLITAVFTNSPFYEFNISKLEIILGIPIISNLAKYFPDYKISAGLSDVYGKSLHQTKHGKYNYNLNWKPVHIPHVNLSFIRAIHQAQLYIQTSCKLAVPLLLMHAEASSKPKKINELAFKTDIVLNVAHMKKYGNNIQGAVTLIAIPNGIHDLVLSAPTVKENVYEKLFDWLTSIDF